MKYTKTRIEKLLVILPMLIYPGVLVLIVVMGFFQHRRFDDRDTQRNIQLERIADALERLAPDE